jgi:hypothetical protein
MPAATAPFNPFAPFLDAFNQSIGRFIYRPVTDWEHFFSPQVVFNYNPQDMPIESQVLARVGSYGSQLSKIISVIDAILANLPADYTVEQRKAVDAFHKLSNEAQSAVDSYRERTGPAALVAAARSLDASPAEKAALLRQLTAILAPDG